MTYIIAVAGPSGSGKTALVNAVAKALNDAAALFYDRYEKATKAPAHDLVKWVEEGANFDEFAAPVLSKDLDKLKRGESVIDPLTKAEISPTKYILFEMPLGKEHKETARYIDLLLWIEIPSDMALARKLREVTANFLRMNKKENSVEFIVWINKYLDNYLKIVREVLQIQKRKVSPNADIIVDGQADLETMVREATRAIRNRLP
jgi:uridine kinase